MILWAKTHCILYLVSVVHVCTLLSLHNFDLALHTSLENREIYIIIMVCLKKVFGQGGSYGEGWCSRVFLPGKEVQKSWFTFEVKFSAPPKLALSDSATIELSFSKLFSYNLVIVGKAGLSRLIDAHGKQFDSRPSDGNGYAASFLISIANLRPSRKLRSNSGVRAAVLRSSRPCGPGMQGFEESHGNVHKNGTQEIRPLPQATVSSLMTFTMLRIEKQSKTRALFGQMNVNKIKAILTRMLLGLLMPPPIRGTATRHFSRNSRAAPNSQLPALTQGSSLPIHYQSLLFAVPLFSKEMQLAKVNSGLFLNQTFTCRISPSLTLNPFIQIRPHPIWCSYYRSTAHGWIYSRATNTCLEFFRYLSWATRNLGSPVSRFIANVLACS